MNTEPNATSKDVELPGHASYSSLSEHRRCPQAWNYSYLQGLQQKAEEVAVERDFGTWWHALRAADSIERAGADLRHKPDYLKTPGGKIYTGGRAQVSAVYAAMERWWVLLEGKRLEDGELVQDVWIGKLGQDPVTRLHTLDAAYCKEYEEAREYELPLGVEVKWKRPLGNTGQSLLGYVDEIFYDRRRRITVARDHKTHKQLSTMTTRDDLVNSQLDLYAWGAADIVKEWGYRIQATAYDRVRMVAPKPPQLTQSGRLAQRGGEPSIGQCDLDTYLLWASGPDGQGVPYPGLKKDGSGAGLYQPEESVIEKLSTPAAKTVWFQRTMTPLNRNVIRAHLQAALDTANDTASTHERVVRSGDAAHNFGDACRYCDFAELCRAELVGGPGGDFKPADFGLVKRPKKVDINS